MSNGTNAKWVTLGKVGGYITDCNVPNKVTEINLTGSTDADITVPSSKMLTALNGLPEGGIVVIRTSESIYFENSTTRKITVLLPTSSSVLNKPFIIAFDGPSNENNFLKGKKSIEIIVKPTEDNSIKYVPETTSTNRRYNIENFSEYRVSTLYNDLLLATGFKPILLFNSYTIKALDDKTWTFTSRDCNVQNPRY